MPLLTSVAVYEVRQSSKTKDCSAPAVTKQIMAACYDLPSVTLLPSSVVPFLFFFLFQKTGTKVSQNCILIPENWDRRFPYFNSSFFGKLGQRYRKTGTQIPRTWDECSGKLGRNPFSVIYSIQLPVPFQGPLTQLRRATHAWKLTPFEKRGIPFIQRFFLYFFLEKSRSETDTGGS